MRLATAACYALGLAGLTITAAGGASADALATPAMGPTLSANPTPIGLDAGPLGKIYVGGVASVLGLTQSNADFGDKSSRGDISNAQVFIQKTDGQFQFFVQLGAYSLPALGGAYVKSGTIVDNTFGPAPVAYAKWAPSSSFNIIAGKLPTLIGSESIFTFQNNNIERGLLWNQEPVVSKGVQANFTKGPLALSLSINDGYYSDRFNWVSGLITWTFNPRDSLTIDGGGNFDHSNKASFATPLVQNDGELINVAFTHAQGPFSITPYFQYTHTPVKTEDFIFHDVSTYGGAVLAKYSFTPKFNVAARAEYIKSSSSPQAFESNVLYGPNSKAYSLTLTPTYQFKIFFVRAEASYTHIDGLTPSFGFGKDGMATSQVRGLVETGVLF